MLLNLIDDLSLCVDGHVIICKQSKGSGAAECLCKLIL